MNTYNQSVTKNGISEEPNSVEPIEVTFEIDDPIQKKHYAKFDEDERKKHVKRNHDLGFEFSHSRTVGLDIERLTDHQERMINSTTANQTEKLNASVNQITGIFDNSLKSNHEKLSEWSKNMVSDISKEVDSKIGPNSDLYKKIDPNNKESVVAAVGEVAGKIQKDFEKAVATQFSKDNPGSLISKFIDITKESNREIEKGFNDFKMEIAEKLKLEEGKQSEYHKGTRKGTDYEVSLFEKYIAPKAHSLGDDIELVKGTPGAIENCKVGDVTITLGETSGAPGEKIAMEIKNRKGITLKKAKEETKTMKENRNAEIGIFVWSNSFAPPEIGNFKKIGNDFYVTAPDDLESDDPAFFVQSTIELSKSILVSESRTLQNNNVDTQFIASRIESAFSSLTKMDELVKKTTTIKNNGKMVIDIANDMKNEIQNNLYEISSMLNGSNEQHVL